MLFRSRLVFFILHASLCMDGVSDACGSLWKVWCPQPASTQQFHLIHRYVTVGLQLEKDAGKYYYEVHLQRGAKTPLIGWANRSIKEKENVPCEGLGRAFGGWSISLQEQLTYRHGTWLRIRLPWTWTHGSLAGSVIGCAIDLDKGAMHFSYNGEWIDAASMFTEHNGSFFPALTSAGEFKIVLANFTHSPPDKQYATLLQDTNGINNYNITTCTWPPAVDMHYCPCPPLAKMPAGLRQDFVIFSNVMKEMAAEKCSRSIEDGGWNCSASGAEKIAYDGCRGGQNIIGCSSERLSRIYLSDLDLECSIPDSLTQLEGIEGMYLTGNRIHGQIPTKFGNLLKLEQFGVIAGGLSGALPSEIGRLSDFTYFDLSENELQGVLPTEFGMLANVDRFRLRSNSLVGQIPTEYGKMQRMKIFELSGNSLVGRIPVRVCLLSHLEKLALNSNILTGVIPSEIGQMSKLINLRLGLNQLEGSLPPQIGKLTACKRLETEENRHKGLIPVFLKIEQLKVLYLSGNKFTGGIPSELGSSGQIHFLALTRNPIQGEIPSQLGKLSLLRHLWLTNLSKVVGTIPSSLGNCTSLSSFYGRGNGLVGPIPPIFQATGMTRLILNSNRLTGSLAVEVGKLSRLKYLMLHHNNFFGSLPTELANNIGLTVFTAHGNDFSGRLGGLSLVPHNDMIILTLHNNMLSCKLPPDVVSRSYQGSIDTITYSLKSVVILGNMFDGPLPKWVNHDEVQSDLLYNRCPGRDAIAWSVAFIGGQILTVMIFRYFFGHVASPRNVVVLVCSSELGVSIIYRKFLHGLLILLPVAFSLLLLYHNASYYYECGQALARLSAAYFKHSWVFDWCTVLVWCMWLGLTSMFTIQGSVLRERVAPSIAPRHSCIDREPMALTYFRRAIGWICALTVLCSLCWPTMLYVIMGSLAHNNTLGLNVYVRRALWSLCPMLQTLNEMFASGIVEKLGSLLRIPHRYLMIVLRMLSGWIVFVLVSIILLANCGGGWKMFWQICSGGNEEFLDVTFSVEHPFDAMLPDEVLQLIDTRNDICSTYKTTWWNVSHCDRSVIENVAFFVSAKLFTQSFLHPAWYVFCRMRGYVFCRMRRKMNHRELAEKQAKISALTIQVAIVWVPFVPLLMPLVILTICVHCALFHLACPADLSDKSREDIELRSQRKAIEQEAGAMLDFLSPSVAVCALFMVRFAHVSDLHGRSLLNVFSILVIFTLLFQSKTLDLLLKKYTSFRTMPTFRTMTTLVDTRGDGLSWVELQDRVRADDVEQAETFIASFPILPPK